VLVGKELKLLQRDPALLSLVLLRVLYFLPLVFVLVRSAVFRLVGQVEIGAGVLVFASSQVAASLAWITVSAEDARDFLLSAPVGVNVLRVAKVVAALLPLAAILALPIVALGLFSPWVAAVTAAGFLCSSFSMGLINLWFESPGQRKSFRRRGGGSLMANLAALVLGMTWAATTVGLAAQSWFSLGGLALTVVVLCGLYLARSASRL
jgi:ABC-2 type transport system permease protein